MIKYGLIVCLIATSGLSAMEVRKDLQGLTYEQLKQLERENQAQDRKFKKKYAPDAWRNNDAIKSKRDAIYDEERALRNAIVMGGFLSFKPHGITNSQPVANIIDNNDDSDDDDDDNDDDGNQLSASLKPYCRRIKSTDIQSDSNQNNAAHETFEDIFNAAIVKPKKIHLLDQDATGLKKRIDALEADHKNLLFTITDDNNDEEELAKKEKQSNALESEIQDLQTRLNALSKQS